MAMVAVHTSYAVTLYFHFVCQYSVEKVSLSLSPCLPPPTCHLPPTLQPPPELASFALLLQYFPSDFRLLIAIRECQSSFDELYLSLLPFEIMSGFWELLCQR